MILMKATLVLTFIALLIISSFGIGCTGDKNPPVISNVAATPVTQSGAFITWITDEPATSLHGLCGPGP